MNLQVSNKRYKRSKKDINQIGNVLIFQLILSGIFSSAFFIVYQYTNLHIIINNLELKSNAILLGSFIANIVTIFLYSKKLQINISSWFVPYTISHREVLVWAILTIGVSKLLGYFGQLTIYVLNRILNANISIPVNAYTASSIWITITTLITHCIIVPIGEECIHRGMVLQSLRKKGNRCAIIASGMIFAMVHTNITPLLSYTAAGMILGYITIKTNSIVPAIMIHSLNNLVIRIQILLGNSLGQYEIIFKEGVDGVFIVIAAIIIVLGYPNEKLYIQDITYDTNTKNIIKDFFKAPLFILAILIYIFVMGLSINR